MACRHGNPVDVCRNACARCGHFCCVHRSDRLRGSDGVGCWECYERCLAWIEPAGVAVLDQGVELIVDDRQAADRRWSVQVRSWGNEAGFLALGPGRAADEVVVDRVALKRAYRGKGIMPEVYEELARLLAPLILTSAIVQSPATEVIWPGMLQRGRAVPVMVTDIGPARLSHFRLETPGARPAGWPGLADFRRGRP